MVNFAITLQILELGDTLYRSQHSRPTKHLSGENIE